MFRLCVVNGELEQERVRQVSQRIAASKRRGALAILENFHRQVRLDRTRHAALVESAAPLDDVIRSEIQGRLGRLYGAGLETSFTQNPALIGGIRITVGSDVYDGSLRRRLTALAARL